MDKTERIWNTYHSRLRGFVQNRVGDASLADDILQDVFVRIQTRLGTLRDDAKIQSWMYRITRNAIIDHFRNLKKTIELPENLVSPNTDLADQTRRELAGCLLPFIESLPDHYREVLLLSEIEGLPHKAVAVKTGLSLSGVKSRVQRGRAMVKRQFLKCCRLEFDHRGAVTDYEKKGDACGPC